MFAANTNATVLAIAERGRGTNPSAPIYAGIR
ncbi:MAG TPA: hypothetical protein VN327_07650 [Pseudonocardiaceae bacterium]|nr:hypothetical protein [Pseudonocardiaceae bacterium]